MNKSPLVSIVITTKNEAKNIENCLRSIQAQSYHNIETIVVDNASTDNTQEIAQRYTEKVFNKGPERSAQRNYGMIDIAQGDYVMFLDADMIMAPEVVNTCIKFIESDNCFVALHIPEIILGKNYWSQVRRFERTFYNGTVIDGARFFKKAIFVEVGGFDTSMSGPEDWDIDKKLKQVGQIGLLPALEHNNTLNSWALNQFISERGIDLNRTGYESVIFHNESEFEMKAYLNKKGYYAQSFDTYINSWGKNDPDIKKQLGLFYRYFGVFLEQGKWKRLFRHPVLMGGMYWLRFLVGLKYIMRH
jgi:glycosyltransferase involved in cell wall biosynthesis